MEDDCKMSNIHLLLIFLALWQRLSLSEGAVVKGPRRQAAVAVDPAGWQRATEAVADPPRAAEDVITSDDVDDWPVYPAGEPRAGEPIMPILPVRRRMIHNRTSTIVC